jgi:hypothetical protein
MRQPWVVNALTGETRSPAVDWLTSRLAELNSPIEDGCNAHVLARHAYVVDYHAHQIYGHLLTLRWRGDNHAVLVRDGRAVRIPVTAGPWKGLRWLLRVARGRSNTRWWAAWLAVPPDVRGLTRWRPTGEGFEASPRGLHAVMPSRRVAIPLIEAALRKHEANPDRQKRQSDALADDVARAVAVAHLELTAQRGIYWDAVRSLYAGGLLLLARDIEDGLDCKGLLSVRRLRKFTATVP